MKEQAFDMLVRTVGSSLAVRKVWEATSINLTACLINNTLRLALPCMRELDLAHMLFSDDALGLVRRGVQNSCSKQQNEGCLPVTYSVMRAQYSSSLRTQRSG